MNRFSPALRRFMVTLLLVLALLPAHVTGTYADDSSNPMPTAASWTKATNTTITPAQISDMMGGSKACVNHNWAGPFPAVTMGFTPCCKVCYHHGSPYCCVTGFYYNIDYWEPSEIIEVSCRTGYSMLSPGNVPTRGGGGSDSTKIQSCQGANSPGHSRWFFEARSWAVNGAKTGLRLQSAMGSVSEQVRQCSLVAGDDVGSAPSKYPGNLDWGYGVKAQQFTRGSANGPGGSWEGYISDKDKDWATDKGGSPVGSQSACKVGSVDMANCWGPTGATGWVSHPNPKFAAALVAWRAHLKAVAAGAVSPADGKGYQMAMEYPFPKYAGAYGASMGIPNGGKTGSTCFKPGDSSLTWWGGTAPESIPDFVKGLKAGTATSVAEVNPGVYIFTIWVHTSCTRYSTSSGKPTETCQYKNGT